MLEGYIDFFMDPSLAECFGKLRKELNRLLQKKVIEAFALSFLIGDEVLI